MDLGLKNKRALILGSSRGLGLGIARALLNEGVGVVVITGRDVQDLTILANKLSLEYKSRVLPVRLDLSEPNAPNVLSEYVTTECGGIDILVNNGGGPPASLASETTISQWHEYFSILVLRFIELTQLLLPGMRLRQWGRVLTIASSGVLQPIPGLALSNALRSALLAWSKTLATEVAKDGITVNTILPGKILTERLRSLHQVFSTKQNKSIQEFEQEILAHIPTGRFGSIEEFADVATFYLSERSSYITGSCIRVDGGYIAAI